MTAPASFRELAKVQARIERALEPLTRDDRVMVLARVLRREEGEARRAVVPTAPLLPLPAPAPQCEFVHADNRCVLYANHFGAHDLAIEDRR